MQCKSVLTRIDAMRTGELPAEEHGVVSEHLRRCKSCDDSVADVSTFAETVKALVVEPHRSCRDAARAAVADSCAQIEIDGTKYFVAFSDRGLRMVHRDGTFDEFRHLYQNRYDRCLEPAPLPLDLHKQVVAGVSGEGVDRPKLDLEALSIFERDVLGVLSRIPRGEVRTYEWVARKAGRPTAVRAVGNVIARNVVPFVVPCHRVVPSTGGVGNYAFGTPQKTALLEREGVPLQELEELGRKGVRYIGSRTTHIFCFPTCRDARRIQQENRVPFQRTDEAVESGYRPCRRCQPLAA